MLYFLLSTHFLFCDFDLRASHARTLLPAALASVPFGFVLVRVRVRVSASEESPGAGLEAWLGAHITLVTPFSEPPPRGDWIW